MSKDSERPLRLVTTLERFQGLLTDRHSLRQALLDLADATKVLLDHTQTIEPTGHFDAHVAWCAAEGALDRALEEDERQRDSPNPSEAL